MHPISMGFNIYYKILPRSMNVKFGISSIRFDIVVPQRRNLHCRTMIFGIRFQIRPRNIIAKFWGDRLRFGYKSKKVYTWCCRTRRTIVPSLLVSSRIYFFASLKTYIFKAEYFVSSPTILSDYNLYAPTWVPKPWLLRLNDPEYKS